MNTDTGADAVGVMVHADNGTGVLHQMTGVIASHQGDITSVAILENTPELARTYFEIRLPAQDEAAVERLLADARSIGYQVVRLESLKFLSAAHALYRSVGFVEIAPYADNSMQAYQPAETMDTYRSSAVFMELRF